MAQQNVTQTSEIKYNVGEVITDSKIWSETSVSGSGGRNNTDVKISTSSTTYTSFMLKNDYGNEYNIQWAGNFGVRQGHEVATAHFRGSLIAIRNKNTQEVWGQKSEIETQLNGEEYRAFNPLISYGVGLTLLALSFVVGLIFLLLAAWSAIVWAIRIKKYKALSKAILAEAFKGIANV